MAFTALIGNMLPTFTGGALVAAKRESRAAHLMLGNVRRANFTQQGPGRVTVFTHSNYVNDPRRKWYGLGGKNP